jgi:urea transport system substrate-binding protein
MAIEESAVCDAVRMAVEDINSSGGVLGRQLNWQLLDYSSEPPIAGKAAQAMLHDLGIRHLFGGWLSASRRAIVNAMQGFDALYWYPVHYEGFEDSRRTIYTGSTINQLLVPMVDFALEQGWRRLYLLGLDQIYSLTVHMALRTVAENAGLDIVGETLLASEGDAGLAAADVAAAQPDVVINTVNGEWNLNLMRRLQSTRPYPQAWPTLSTSLSEVCAQRLGKVLDGSYTLASYLQSSEQGNGQNFARRFAQRYGGARAVSETMANAYSQLMCWRELAIRCNSLEPAAIYQAVPGFQTQCAAGHWSFRANHHVQKPMFVAQFGASGETTIVHNSDGPIAPDPWLGMAAHGSRHGRMLRQLVHQLSDRVQSARSAQIKTARQAQDLDRLSFVNAHSLQEPTRSLLGLLEVLQEQLPEDRSSEARRTMSLMTHMAHRMSAMVHAMLNLSLVGRGPLQAIDLQPPLDQAWQQLAQQPGWSQAMLESEGLPVVLGREDDISQMWTQLLKNALRFRRKRMPLLIRVRAMDELFQWRIVMDDNGQGLTHPDTGSAFALFNRQQHTSSDAAQNGVGAGLALVKKIVESLEGRVSMQTNASGGVRVCVILPKYYPRDGANEPSANALPERMGGESASESKPTTTLSSASSLPLRAS